MAQQAQVTSVEAIESFRSTLVVYLSQARPALEEVGAEVVRTRAWLEYDQRTRWESELRRRTRELQEAQQALFSSKLGPLRRETSSEQMLVQRAKRSVAEAQEKLRLLKKWTRDFDGAVQPLLKQIEKLQTILTNDMAKAVAHLGQTVNTLAAYAEIHPAAPAAAPPPAEAGVPKAST